jgi:hypothetical protein
MEWKNFKKKGEMRGAVGAIIALVVGIGVAAMVLIFVGVLSGQTFQMSQAQITAITNTTIQSKVRASIVGGFDALQQTSQYLPLVVLAVVIFLVLSLVLGFTNVGGGGNSAL